MNENEKKRFRFCEEIHSFFNENREFVAKIPGLAKMINKLLQLMDDIRKTDKEITSAALLRTIKVNQSKDELINILIPVISALFRFAKETDNILLKEKTKLRKSSLLLLRNFELYNKSIFLQNCTEKYIGKLSGYGVNARLLNQLKNSVSEFRNIISNGVNSIFINGTPVTLEFLFNECNKILNNIDTLIETFSGDEIFYEEYQAMKESSVENEYEEDLLYELEEKE